ncbi:MAG: hypothetical protein ACYDHE_02265 [Candidatus Acidiferrales bacterium]
MPIQINRTGPSLAEVDHFAYHWEEREQLLELPFPRSTTLRLILIAEEHRGAAEEAVRALLQDR